MPHPHRPARHVGPLSGLLLQAMAWTYNLRPDLRRWLRDADGWLDVCIGFATESGALAWHLRLREGRMRVGRGMPADTDARLIFADEAAAMAMITRPPNESMLMLLESRLQVEGNLNALSLFQFLQSRLVQGRMRRQLRAAATARAGDGAASGPSLPPAESVGTAARPRLHVDAAAGVEFLPDPYLSALDLADFPRLVRFRDAHFTTTPEICPERPVLLTRWYREHGLEDYAAGAAAPAVLRQGRALGHLLAHKEARIADDDLLAGTTTTKDVGVVIYPDAHGPLIWGELWTVDARPLNPYRVAPETRQQLHDEVFGYWLRRGFRAWVRERFDAPLGQRIDERFAAYFAWKTVALSHTVPDFPLLLERGTQALRAQLAAQQNGCEDAEARETLAAMDAALAGLEAYGDRLAARAVWLAGQTDDPRRRGELELMAATLRRVPRRAAETLDEAVQMIWLSWIALHMENTNAGLSLGRLDQWLQPYFAADMRRCADDEARAARIRHAVELLGCFFLRCADHLPLVPDIGNVLFGGSSSDQAITLGGVTADGDNAVNDMTYVLLKVTEMLRLRDPNVNARYHRGVNDRAYLDRLCEVNLVTAATPSIHGDENVIASLVAAGHPLAAARDWSATGCVEPTLSGRHMGHTGCLMFNLVAPLEMALNDGWHPLMRWQLGPRTGAAFTDFDAFYDAYLRQLDFLVQQATGYNNQLGAAHAELRPTPLLSACIDGCIERGRDATRGGARFNSSGVACIGLSDVVDSLAAIRQLVFGERAVDMATLRQALAADFAGHEALARRIDRDVLRFGSGDPQTLALAQQLVDAIHGAFAARRNFRGGPYQTGFWSMSNHVAFGRLTGALPSGRRAGKSFTPGLTPAAAASCNLLDNLRDVATLPPAAMANNIAFNVKFVPSASDAHATTVGYMRGYTDAYVGLGGMQMQLNVVSSATLRDAMARPEQYRDLLVRISGYNAYFVTLNRDMQIELIERSEFVA